MARVDNRPEAISRRQLADAIDGGPYMVAQRQRLRGLFGPAAQLKGPEDDGLIQGRFVPIQTKSGWEGNEGGKFHRVANKDNVKAVPRGELGLPAKSIPVDGTAESKGRCWYPAVAESAKDDEQVKIVVEHDSDGGGKITPYDANGYPANPPKKAFTLPSHFHNGTLPARRVKTMDKAGKDNFSDKPVTYTDTMHLYEDSNGPATFKKGL